MTNRGGNGQANSNIVVELWSSWRRRWSVDEYLVVSHGGVVNRQCASTPKRTKAPCVFVVSRAVPCSGLGCRAWEVVSKEGEFTGIGREQ